jgi:purine-nucleoside phosphorylase
MPINVTEAINTIRRIATESSRGERFLSLPPRAAIILGSGLGGLTHSIEDALHIPFADIPHFARSTAVGHRGELVLGTLAGVPIVAMAGRFHRYEGWTNEQVTFPVRVLAALGVSTLIVSNAAGGLRPHYCVGDIMVIRDHIQRMPLATSGQPDVACGTSGIAPPCSVARNENPYCDHLATLALRAGRLGDFMVHEGTYLATLGPTYETRAEYRMMRRMGADCVGMSTVPEVLQAQQAGLNVLALSMISNVARPDAVQETTHQEVLDAGRLAEPRMSYLVNYVLSSL